MKRILSALSVIFGASSLSVSAQYGDETMLLPLEEAITAEALDSVGPSFDSTLFIVRELPEILEALGTPAFKPTPVNKVFGPWVFSGYRTIPHKEFSIEQAYWYPGIKVRTNSEADPFLIANQDGIFLGNEADSVAGMPIIETVVEELPSYPILEGDGTPEWLRDALTAYRIQENFMYAMMVDNPYNIEFSYWGLPERPRLPEDDVSFAAYIRKLDLPDLDPEENNIRTAAVRQIHWLHKMWANMQFSQAFVSKNWYQGGNNALSLLFDLGWNVDLNQVYHPKLLFQSALRYKLGLNSVQNDEYRKYSISEDVLQYNLNAGLKALKKWYYSFNMQFKTQLFNHYPVNSNTRTASFLSPGDFNVGLGMSYNTENKLKKFKLTATISPISYNLKTCIAENSKISHDRFNIKPNRYVSNEIGSNAEVNMLWNIAWNIEYKTRLFLFSDYKYFLGDWENTFNFSVNKYLSTQIYLRMRYDTSVTSSTSWKKFMMREILSFGLTYTFSTKP